MKTKYNQLREEIIKAVPEIMKLEVGCKIINQIKDGTQKFDHTIIGSKIIGTNHYPVSYNTSINEDQIIDIIGRDITLEDCLIAFLNSKPREDKIIIQGQIVCRWSWGKPLQDQSEETIELLFELICVKNAKKN